MGPTIIWQLQNMSSVANEEKNQLINKNRETI